MGEARTLILASASPRRRALLEQVGIEFESLPAEGAEGARGEGESPAEYARRSAEAKSAAVSRRRPHALVLGADTVVALGDRVLGKPAGPSDARRMLEELSGRSHRVHTAVSVALGGRVLQSDVVTTEVYFRQLSSEEIEGYVASGEPMDKAGAYGIQGRGALLVDRIDGCYFNVVGLPLSRTRDLLVEASTLINKRSGDGKC